MTRQIDFDTTIEDEGIIRIPDRWKNGVHRGETVHVTLAQETNGEEKQKITLPEGARMTRTVRRMIENPFHAPPGFKPLTREEVHDRDRDRREIH